MPRVPSDLARFAEESGSPGFWRGHRFLAAPGVGRFDIISNRVGTVAGTFDTKSRSIYGVARGNFDEVDAWTISSPLITGIPQRDHTLWTLVRNNDNSATPLRIGSSSGARVAITTNPNNGFARGEWNDGTNNVLIDDGFNGSTDISDGVYHLVVVRLIGGTYFLDVSEEFDGIERVDSDTALAAYSVAATVRVSRETIACGVVNRGWTDEELVAFQYEWAKMLERRPILVDVAAGGGITGTISQTLSVITQAASGTVQQQVTGTASQTLSAVSQSAAGTTQQLLTGTVSQTLSPISQSATGTVQDLLTGTISQTLSALSQSATAAITYSGTISQTLSAVSQSATGAVGDVVFGTITQSLSPITQSLSASLNFQATIAQTLSPISQSLTGVVAENITGTITQTLSAVQLSATETAQFTGTMAMTLPALSMDLSGFNIINQVLPSNRVIFDTADARIVIDGADGRIVYDEPDSRTQADG